MNNTMKKLLLLMLVLAAPCWATQPLIRVMQEPETPLHAGQSLTLKVQVLVPNYFLAAPDFPRLELSGGPAGTLQDSSGNLVEHIADQDYAGIERNYRFPPLAAGDYWLAPAEVRLRYAEVNHQPLEVRLPLPTLRIQVAAALAEPGAAAQGQAQLSLSESYTPDITQLQRGDLLTRRLQLELRAPGTLLPPTPPLSTPTGVRLYHQAPLLEKGDERSGQTIRRIDEVHYLFEQDGPVMLPAVQLHWRNTLTGQLETAELPARHLHIAAGGEPQTAPDQSYAVVLGLLGLFGALLTGALYRWPGWRQRYAAWCEERQRWRVFRLACASGQLGVVESTLEHWLHLSPEPLDPVRDAPLQQAIQALLRQRYSAEAARFEIQGLYRAATQVRRQRKTRSRPAERTQRLNPSSD